MEAVLNDKRFAHIAKDPRFHRMPKGDRKVKIDKRFKDMFKDKKFKLKYTVDSRGRTVNQSTNEDLKKFYELSDSEDSDESDEESDDNEEDDDVLTKRLQKSDSENSSEEDGDTESSDEEIHSKVSAFDKKKPVGKKEKQMKKKKNESKLTKIKKNVNGEDTDLSEKTKSVRKKERKKKSEDVIEPGTSGVDKNVVTSKEAKAKIKKDQMSNKVLDKDVDYARGEGFLDSSSSDDDSDGSLEKESTDFDHKWNEQDDNIEEVGEATRRLAMCNMDWDRIKAKDIFFLLSSFKPAQGLVKSVKVYPSEFGKERMEQETLEGPRELREMTAVDEAREEELDKDGTKFQTEKLRQYQLLRLKYYYAVIECDSAETADHIYKECDSKEYESSSTKVDLRFVPDDMEFEDEPSSSCTDVPSDYKPNHFFNTALSQSKVDLTWDETDRDRSHKISKQFDPKGEDLEEDDLNAYLASSSDEEAVDYGDLVEQSDSDDDDGDDPVEEDKREEKQISKYKMLLQEIDQEEKKKKDSDIQMEITWEPGLKEATEEMVKKKKEKSETKVQTSWDDYLQRRKEKKRARELDKKHQRLLQQTAQEPGAEEEEDDDGDDDIERDEQEEEQAFSDDDLPAGVDMNDPFFVEEMEATEKSQKADKKKKKKKKQESQETEEDLKEKEALSLLMLGEEDGKKHFNVKNLVDPDKKKKKKKKDKLSLPANVKEDDFQVNVQDPRFTAMYDSHLFNLDPSAPEFRKTKGTEAIVEEKLKRSKKKGSKNSQNPKSDSSSAKKRKLEEGVTAKDESLLSLVNSVKMKTKQFKTSKSKV